MIITAADHWTSIAAERTGSRRLAGGAEEAQP
jgi:hypothetical protein